MSIKIFKDGLKQVLVTILLKYLRSFRFILSIIYIEISVNLINQLDRVSLPLWINPYHVL